jgi:hypothetical protein
MHTVISFKFSLISDHARIQIPIDVGAIVRSLVNLQKPSLYE